MCKIVEANINKYLDGKNMKVNSIQDDGVRLIRKILGYKLNHGSRVDSVLEGFIHTSYFVLRGKEVNLCDIVRTQLLDNISKIKKTKSMVFTLESLLMHIFFYATKIFLGISNWDGNECTMQIINPAY